MKVFTIEKAQANIEALVAAVRAGEEVYISRRATPVATVVPYRRERPKLRVGSPKPKTSHNQKKQR